MRCPHHVGVKRNAHDAAVLRPFAIDRVEMVDDHLREFLGLDRLAVDQRVVEIHRVGHVDQGAAAGGKRRRLVVVIEVADVVEARLLHEVGRVEGVGDGGRKPATQLAASQPEVRGLAVLDDGALFILAIAPVIARVEVTVAHVLPAPGFHGFQDLGIHFDHRHRKRDRAAHAVLVQHLEHPPQADAVAVVAAAITQHIGMRHARPWIAHADLGRNIFVVLDIGADPDRDAGVVRPGQLRSLDDRRIAVAVRVHR